MDPQADLSSDEVLPPGLPKPENDHACDHLWGMAMPSVTLHATSGTAIDVSKLQGYSVIFCYPRTGRYKERLPADWDAIPGARGCTPQACSFKAATAALKELKITNIYGLSTQETDNQRECRDRLKLGYDLLSDAEFRFCSALRLPMFEWGDMRLVKRITLLLDHGKIVWVDYPVYPADKSAEKVVEFMEKQPINLPGGGRCGDDAVSLAEADSAGSARATSGSPVSARPPSVGSPAPLQKPQAPENPCGSGSVLKKHGPASNYHPCSSHILEMARKASVAGGATTKETVAAGTAGDDARNQESSAKKYSFHLSGGCTTN